MDDSQKGESRKKGIAITAMTGILAYHPKTWIEIVAAILVAGIAFYAINRQSNIDKE